MQSLKYHVSLRDDNGDTHTFGPGDEVPAWALELIQNPSVWEADPEIPAPSEGESGSSSEGVVGSGPFKGRSADELRALFAELELEYTNRNEAVAELEALGYDPETNQVKQ